MGELKRARNPGAACAVFWYSYVRTTPMRAWITALLCVTALTLALTGMVAGQDQQGPVRENSGTVAKKKSTAPDAPPDGELPKIPSAYKKDKMDVGNLTQFKTDVDTVTVDIAIIDNKGDRKSTR